MGRSCSAREPGLSEGSWRRSPHVRTGRALALFEPPEGTNANDRLTRPVEKSSALKRTSALLQRRSHLNDPIADLRAHEFGRISVAVEDVVGVTYRRPRAPLSHCDLVAGSPMSRSRPGFTRTSASISLRGRPPCQEVRPLTDASHRDRCYRSIAAPIANVNLHDLVGECANTFTNWTL